MQFMIQICRFHKKTKDFSRSARFKSSFSLVERPKSNHHWNMFGVLCWILLLSIFPQPWERMGSTSSAGSGWKNRLRFLPLQQLQALLRKIDLRLERRGIQVIPLWHQESIDQERINRSSSPTFPRRPHNRLVQMGDCL